MFLYFLEHIFPPLKNFCDTLIYTKLKIPPTSHWPIRLENRMNWPGEPTTPSGRKRFRSTGLSRQTSLQNTSGIPAKKKKNTHSHENTEHREIRQLTESLDFVRCCGFAGRRLCGPACGRRAAWATVGWRRAAEAGTSPASVCFLATSATAAPSRPPRCRHRLHRHRSRPPRPRAPLELIPPRPSAGPVNETLVRVSPARPFSSENYTVK